MTEAVASAFRAVCRLGLCCALSAGSTPASAEPARPATETVPLATPGPSATAKARPLAPGSPQPGVTAPARPIVSTSPQPAAAVSPGNPGRASITAEGRIARARNLEVDTIDDSSVLLRLVFDSAPSKPHIERLEDGRIVIDVPRARTALGYEARSIDHPLVRRARFGQHDNPTRLRIVLDGAGTAAVSATQSKVVLEIRLTVRADRSRQASSPMPASATPPATPDPSPGPSLAPAPRTSPGTSLFPSPVSVSPITPEPAPTAAASRAAAIEPHTRGGATPEPDRAATATPETQQAIIRQAPAATPTAATISLHFVDADAATVIRLVAEAGGLEVRLPPGRTSPLTIALRHVTPRDALVQIGKSVGWTLRQDEGDVLSFEVSAATGLGRASGASR